MIFPAHIRDQEEVQPVQTHCRACAAYAAVCAPPGMEKLAVLAGLLHDTGKFTIAFANYITKAAHGEPVRPGSVNHTFAGVRFALTRWHRGDNSCRDLTCELLAFAIGSHHGQFDAIAPGGADGYLHRVTDESVPYEEAIGNYLHFCADTVELDALFDAAVRETEAALRHLQPLASSQEEMLFYLSLLARQILSAVMEGDRRDTAEFMGNFHYPQSPVPHWDDLLAVVEAQISALPANTPINAARRQISDSCKAAASRGPGVYRLNVPTGGGKTLASLRYALAAADTVGQKRIIFLIPLLSILEQNARVIREALGNDVLILEHHSNLMQEKSSDEQLDLNELLMQTWDAPVIISTLVQFLNTLLLGKSSCIRRMNALSDSVIIIDEVQSVPRNMLGEFNLALNYLAGFCRATVVLCSATQPCLEHADHMLRYAPQPELVPYTPALWSVFCRTQIFDRRTPPFRVESLADFAVEQAGQWGSLLLICNKKQEAADLFDALEKRWGGKLFHLSTGMCMAHRIDAMEQITAALTDKKPIICVSTQLVEAGVNFSFGCVVRILAGLDNVVQSAGRCNRSGEKGKLCPVYIVNLQGENLSRLKEMDQAQKAAQSVLLLYARDAAAFGNNLCGESAINTYYRTLYAGMDTHEQDYPLAELSTTLFELLSVNNATARAKCPTGGHYLLGQAFRTAGENFRVFDDDTTDVLVPYMTGAELIADFGTPWAKYNFAQRAELLKKAKPFSISLFRYQLDKLQENHGVYPLCEGAALALCPEYYSPMLGFVPEGNVNTLLEV